jgi:hypothetical protein
MKFAPQSEYYLIQLRTEPRSALTSLGDAGTIVLALVKQDPSKLGVSVRQAGVDVHSRLRQFLGVIERSGTEIASIERFGISGQVSPGQHRLGPRAVRVDRPGSVRADALSLST